MESQQDFLQPLEQEIYHERVSAGTRFANYIIDVIIFYILAFIAGMVIGVASIASRSNSYYESSPSGGSIFVNYIVAAIVIVGYYTLIEGAFKGRTIGKMITGSKAVMNDGSELTWKVAFLRSLSRIVPFEPFSGFSGNPCTISGLTPR